MAENINITQIDDTKVREKIGRPSQSVHARIFKEYNIELDKKDGKALRPIPTSWIQNIIDKNIDLIDISPTNLNKNIKNRTLTLIFNTIEEASEFENLFQKGMFKAINTFIEEQNEKPRNYNRNVITTTELEGLQLQISY